MRFQHRGKSRPGGNVRKPTVVVWATALERISFGPS